MISVTKTVGRLWEAYVNKSPYFSTFSVAGLKNQMFLDPPFVINDEFES